MIKCSLLASAVIVGALSVHPAWADEETDLLRQQVKELEARLDALERKEAQEKKQASAAPAKAAPVANAVLEQRVATLEQKTPDIEYKPGHGLTIASPDKALRLRVGGYFQADGRAFLDNANSTNQNQFLIRSARPIVEAELYDTFSARLMTDFGNNQTTLLDAYGDYHADKAFNIRVGKFKDPIGLERWQSEQNVLFVERGMTTNLVPYRDIGFQFYGDALPHLLEYQLAFTNGTADLVNSTGSTDGDKTVTARLFVHPFYNGDTPLLKGVGAGFAASVGGRDGSVANPGLTAGYVTPGQAKFFTYATTAFANGGERRYNPEATYYNGPFSLIGEYVREDFDVQSGRKSAELSNTAWLATATYVVTGEDASFNGVIPRNDFDPAHGLWGAFELVGRVSHLRIDDATFPTFASLSASAKAATESTVGGTWYLNPAIKLNLDFALTRFDGGAVSGDRPSERAVLSRAQFSF